ncbi:hypothetical protein HZB03_04290 [Candidatus Woesearchaeota archaeon]|nr:hypothetical protein [Candidatus Woesearchaeota archaeon]
MVYHFFSKWKETESEVFSIRKELVDIERHYKLRITLWERIWRSRSEHELDFHSAKKLLKLYRAAKHIELYETVIEKLRKISSIGLLNAQEVTQFYDLSVRLLEKATEENQRANAVLQEIIAGKLPEAASLYAIQDLLKDESEFFKIEDEKFKKAEETFLLKKEPGPRLGTYQPIVRAIMSGDVVFKDKSLWVGSKSIQGLTVVHNKLILKGDHYTSLQNARWIQGDVYVKPSRQDPYSYFVERGKLGGVNQRSVQKLLGISAAEAVVGLEIEIFPEQLYIRVQPHLPIKFAIANLEPNQVRKVVQKATAVAA